MGPGVFEAASRHLRDERRNTGVKNFEEREILMGQKAK
jgi:hypothetical protein